MKARIAITLVGLAAGWAHATTFTVINNNDAGVGSLRDTIATAIADGTANTIQFAGNVTGTIVLTSGQILITGPLTIAGPGRDVLAIDGNLTGRVFSIIESVATVCPALTGPSDYLVSISGLTLKNASRNVADSSGGAIQSAKSLMLDGMTIRDSHAKNGGGVKFNVQYTGQTLTITNSQFLNNIAKPTVPGNTDSHNGGGLFASYNCSGPTLPFTVSISSSLFSGNRVQPVDLEGRGGALAAFGFGTLTITDTRIVDNHVDVPNPRVSTFSYPGGGGSIAMRTVTILRTEISDNSADYGGGLAMADDLGSQTPGTEFVFKLIDSTISGNTANLSGGGINLYANLATELDNSTVSNNSGASGRTGGVRFSTAAGLANPTLKLVSSILANSAAGTVDCGAIPAVNVDSTDSLGEAIAGNCTLVGSGNLSGVDPVLGPLAFNGGPTRTHALLAGSPAINAGTNPIPLGTDQRGAGFPRAVGAATDMGAYEFSPGITPSFQSAVSRKVHGAAGTFNLPLSAVATAPTTEPRTGPAQTIVFTFDRPILSATVAITEGTATAAAPSFTGNGVIVGLTGVTNQQYVTIGLTSVSSVDGGTGGSGSVRVGFLLADVNQNRVISVADVGLVNAQLAQTVTAANYLKDVNASGTLTVADKGITNANLTRSLPTP
jgi:hypothetical protein